MKIISLTMLSLILSVSLFARLNPFEPTDHFLEQKEIIIKANELEKIKQDQAEQNRIAQEFEDQKMAELKIAEKMMAEKKLKEEIEAKKEKAEAVKIAIVEPTIEVKKTVYIPEIKENFKVLPFVKIYVVNDILTIEVDKKYKLLNQDILKPVKKLLFDFEGKVSFYTIRKDIISEDFKSFAVGTHMDKNFFRIVIDLPYDIINYNEQIDSQNGIITITKK